MKSGRNRRSLPQDPGVLQTKLTPPSAWYRAIARPQLVAHLGAPRPLTVICAPPGYGKTSAAVAWLGTLGLRRAWLSLDRRDDDPARFVRGLAAAIQAVAPDCGRAVSAMGDRLRADDVPFVIDSLLNDLHATDAEFALVLDDFQFVADATILGAIEALVEGLTPKLSVVIITRQEPALPLPRWRLSGRLTELGQEELRLSPQEAEAFINASMGLDLPPADIAHLHARTEGWIGGLQLAALSMQGAVDRPAIIDAFDGRNRFVMDYLIEEVLAAQQPEIKQFLLQTSILDRMCASLCEAVTGMPGSAAILDRLERLRLFVVPLDDRREWFRYHALFADLLQHQLGRSADLRMSDCRLAASAWYEQRGVVDEAAEYALAAGNAERVAAIVVRHGRDMFLAGQSKRLHEVLGQVPVDLLAANPDRLSVALWARFNREGTYPVTWLRRLEDMVRDDPDAERRVRITDELRLLGAIEAVRINRDHAAAINLASPDRARRGYSSPLVANLAPGLVAAAAHKLGDRDRATAAYRQAVEAALAERSVTMFFVASLGQGRLAAALHGPRAGRQSLDRASATAERMGWGELPFMSWLLCGEAECAAEMDDPATEGLYAEAIRLSRCEPPVVRHVARIGLAGVLWRSGRKGEAEAALEELSQVSYVKPFMPVLPDFEVALARHDLARGRPGRAGDLIERRGLLSEPLTRDATDDEVLLLGRWLIGGNRPCAAIPVLTALVARAEAENWLDTLIRARIDLAAARLLGGEVEAAHALLARALTDGQPAGFVRCYFDAPGPVTATLRTLAKAEGGSDMARFARRLTEGGHQNGACAPDDPLSPRERRVLQQLSLGLTTRELATRLFVSENTIKTHLKNIYGKIGARNRAEAVLRAQALGLGPTKDPA